MGAPLSPRLHEGLDDAVAAVVTALAA
jgi:hypothetical protein